MPIGVYIKTEEHKRRLSETMKRLGHKPPSSLGRRHSNETLLKMSVAHKGKKRPMLSQMYTGEGNPFFGKKHTREARLKISETNSRSRPKMQGENNAQWKGEGIKYRRLHSWVQKYLGKPNTCEHCGKTNLSGHSIHWANKSREYLRDLTDWIRLCVKCHKQYDYARGN